MSFNITPMGIARSDVPLAVVLMYVISQDLFRQTGKKSWQHLEVYTWTSPSAGDMAWQGMMNNKRGGEMVFSFNSYCATNINRNSQQTFK